MAATHAVHPPGWVAYPILVVMAAAFLLYLFSVHPWRWIPFMTLFSFAITWVMLEQEHWLRGWQAVAIASVVPPVLVPLLRWFEVKGWLTWDGDGDAFP